MDAVETYPHAMFKDIIQKKEKIKRLNIVNQYKK